MYTHGVFAVVPREKIANLLKRAYAKGHSVGAKFYFFDSWYLTALPASGRETQAKQQR